MPLICQLGGLLRFKDFDLNQAFVQGIEIIARGLIVISGVLFMQVVELLDEVAVCVPLVLV
jgi:hypothetical protein